MTSVTVPGACRTEETHIDRDANKFLALHIAQAIQHDLEKNSRESLRRLRETEKHRKLIKLL